VVGKSLRDHLPGEVVISSMDLLEKARETLRPSITAPSAGPLMPQGRRRATS
jgi:hypothetical protein